MGIELQINHLRSIKEGVLTAVARPVHIGKTLHLWIIEIRDDKKRLIAHAKLTNMILNIR
jgi:uncharacterized protein (TIGR00369 family)